MTVIMRRKQHSHHDNRNVFNLPLIFSYRLDHVIRKLVEIALEYGCLFAWRRVIFIENKTCLYYNDHVINVGGFLSHMYTHEYNTSKYPDERGFDSNCRSFTITLLCVTDTTNYSCINGFRKSRTRGWQCHSYIDSDFGCLNTIYRIIVCRFKLAAVVLLIKQHHSDAVV